MARLSGTDVPADVADLLFQMLPAASLRALALGVDTKWRAVVAVLGWRRRAPALGSAAERLEDDSAARLLYLRGLGLVRPTPGAAALPVIKEERVAHCGGAWGDTAFVLYPQPVPTAAGERRLPAPEALANLALAHAGPALERAVTVRRSASGEVTVRTEPRRAAPIGALPYASPELRDTVAQGGFLGALAPVAVALGHAHYDGLGRCLLGVGPVEVARVGPCVVTISRARGDPASARLVAFDGATWAPLWDPASAAMANLCPARSTVLLHSVSPMCAAVYATDHPRPLSPVPAAKRRKYGAFIAPVLVVWWSRLFGLRVNPVPDLRAKAPNAGWEVVPDDAECNAPLFRLGCPA